MTNADRAASGVWHIGFCESQGYDGQTESAARELFPSQPCSEGVLSWWPALN